MILTRKILIANAKGEEAIAEAIAVPLSAAGYDIVHGGTFAIGESIIGETSMLLAQKVPIVLCATYKAVSSKWTRSLVNAAKSCGSMIFILQMDEDIFMEQLALDNKIGEYWKDPAGTINELISSLLRHYPHVKNANTMQNGLKIVFLHDYILPKKFIARENEIKKLKDAIAGKMDISTQEKVTLLTIVAIGGTGKSCLARKIVDDIEKNSSFRYIIWFSFYDSKTEDESYFFKKILEVIDENFHVYYKDLLNEISSAGEQSDNLKSSETKYLKDRACKIIDETETLFFIDGLEIIQNIVDEKAYNYGNLSNKFSHLESFLRHVCNNHFSMAIITSRVWISNFRESEGYLEMELGTFSEEEGGEYLKSFNVIGTKSELNECSGFLGNHALCLKAAGLYLGRVRVPCTSLKKELDKRNIVYNSKEGEKLVRILELFRQQRLLTKEQEYFLKMLSLSDRPVTNSDFKILVADYNDKTKGEIYVRIEIIEPLLKLGLIDEIFQLDTVTFYYSVHPLLKFAYRTWFDDSPLNDAYEIWAQAAEAKGMQANLDEARLIEHIQDLIDAMDFYSKADNLGGLKKIFLTAESFIPVNTVLMQSIKWKPLWQEYMERIENAIEENKIIFSESDKFRFYFMSSFGSEALQKKVIFLEKALAIDNFSHIYSEEFLINHMLGTYIQSGLITKAHKFLKKHRLLLKYHEDFMNTLSMLEFAKGNYKKAAEILNDEISFAIGHEKTKLAWKLAPCLMRMGDYDGAENILINAIEDNTCQSCNSNILRVLIMLEIRRKNPEKAQEYHIAFSSLHNDYINPLDYLNFENYQPGDLINLATGNHKLIIADKEKKMDSEYHNQVPSEKVLDLVLLIKGYICDKDYANAAYYYDLANQLMKENGFWKYKDEFSEIKDILWQNNY